ncbi:hypothetical protein [uncultured Kocuria sp.]|uniref:hypothetical protein n=1 Tax=uncultured Kocuria sp. TaxID=259305 RepID=UPI00262A9E3F|nr:hypothetical protein [uncultured Kocuria sp.]
MTDLPYFEVITSGVALVALLVAWHQLRAALYVRRREFEDIYVQRYWQISDRMDVTTRMSTFTQTPAWTDEDMEGVKGKLVWDYLSLCEDEVDLRRAGHITDETWAIWRTSISGAAGRFPYTAMFEAMEERFEAHGVPENERPFTNLRMAWKAGNDVVDPLELGRMRRWGASLRQFGGPTDQTLGRY